MPTSVFTEEDYRLINEEYKALYDSVSKTCTPEGLAVIERAFEFANHAHKNVRRRSGAPYMLHPIAVARIVADEIGLDYRYIASALLHDVVEDTEHTIEDISSSFGEDIAHIVDGLTKIKNVFGSQGEGDVYSKSIQADNLKRILLTLDSDHCVVLVKMADRLHNCRTIEFMPEYKRDKILSETMFIFIPLAHTLGLYRIKSELEDIWLRYKEPKEYATLSERINKNVKDLDKKMDIFEETLRRALEGKFDFEIKRRVKTPYSVWRKMQVKKVTFDQIYDLYALRIIFEPKTDTNQSERDQCFHIYSIISDIYQSRPDRIRDWVSNSKPNGYEALHCTLKDNETGLVVEVQIRSTRMNEIAEKGIASHWSYKDDGFTKDPSSKINRTLEKIRDSLHDKGLNSQEFLETIHEDLMMNDIVVFTPKGAPKNIPKNSTALDFAYKVHTEIGNKAIAAKVNQKPVGLSHVLKEGDIVEVITAEDAHPRKESLAFLKTRTAKNRIIDWFRQDFQHIKEQGYQDCSHVLEKLEIELTPKIAGRIASRMGYNNADEFMFRLGLDLIDRKALEELAKQIKETAQEEEAAIRPEGTTRIDKENFEITSEGEGRIYKIANCCNPIAGDPIVGFKTPDGGITIHKKTCPVADSLAARHGDWIIMPKWSMTRHQFFLVRIRLSGIDRFGLLNEITRCISLIMGVNIKSLSIGASDGLMDGKVDLFVQSRQILEELMDILRGISGITNVERMETSTK